MHEIPIADATNMQSARHFVSSSPCLLVSCLALLLLPDPWLMLAQRRAPSTQIRPFSRTAPERNPERTGDDMAGILIHCAVLAPGQAGIHEEHSHGNLRSTNWREVLYCPRRS
jgi:hypothetical protein